MSGRGYAKGTVKRFRNKGSANHDIFLVTLKFQTLGFKGVKPQRG